MNLFIRVCNFIVVDNNENHLECCRSRQEGWDVIFVCFVGLVPLRFLFFFSFFYHRLSAFLNYHCEHGLWKASLHHICWLFDIIFLFFWNNFDSKKKEKKKEKLPKLHENIHTKAIHDLYENQYILCTRATYCTWIMFLVLLNHIWLFMGQVLQDLQFFRMISVKLFYLVWTW